MYQQAPWMMAPNRMPVAQQFTPNTQPNPMMAGLLAPQAPQAQGSQAENIIGLMGQMAPVLGLLSGGADQPVSGVENLPAIAAAPSIQNPVNPSFANNPAVNAQMQFQNMMGGQDTAPQAGGMGMLQNWFSNWRGT